MVKVSFGFNHGDPRSPNLAVVKEHIDSFLEPFKESGIDSCEFVGQGLLVYLRELDLPVQSIECIEKNGFGALWET